MTLDQIFAFALVAITIGAFAWGRLPYDLVAITALTIGIVLGIVPANKAFEGFSSDVVIIVGAALILSTAVARSGVVETLMRPIIPKLRTVQSQVPVLVGATLLLSMFTKNVGALAIFMPVALQLARRTKTAASSLLMPMSFASLIGGIVTLVGTSPNIIVSQVRADLFGRPFGMFDFAPVGLGIACVGYAFLCVGWRLLPRGRKAAATMEAAFSIDRYATEAHVMTGSPADGATVAAIEAMAEGDVKVSTVVRERFRRYIPEPEWIVRGDDVLILSGESTDLERLMARSRMVLATEDNGEAHELAAVEGVVTSDSSFTGRTPAELDLSRKYRVNLLAVSRSGEGILQKLSSLRLRVGDVLVLRGPAATLPELLGDWHILPLAERGIALGRHDRSWLPAAILAIAMVLVAAHIVPVAVAFFGAVAVTLLLRSITTHEAYQSVEWPLLILLGALIPVSEAISTTGGADLVAGWLTHLVQGLSPTFAVGITLVLAMAAAPFMHNAPTVLVLGPIAAKLATQLSLNPDTFLMAVALGAACDFLTPIGHQCNTLVMGPGGYRFGDYARLGFPLSIIVIVVGIPLLTFFWPLQRP